MATPSLTRTPMAVQSPLGVYATQLAGTYTPPANPTPLIALARAAQTELGTYAVELRLIARGEVWPRHLIRLNGGTGQAPTPALQDRVRDLNAALYLEALKHGFRSAGLTPIWQGEA
jgi:hypothetical protein